MLIELLTPDELLLQDSIRKFFAKELDPIAEELEKDGKLLKGLILKMGELGFLGTFLP